MDLRQRQLEAVARWHIQSLLYNQRMLKKENNHDRRKDFRRSIARHERIARDLRGKIWQ